MSNKKEKKAQEEALNWYFPSTGNGENDGFNDPQLEYFQGDHEKYIAREMIQNSIDARFDNSLPVSVVFERISIPTSEFPQHKDFRKKLERCMAFVGGQDNAVHFFKSAIDLLNKETLPVLKVSDFNTWGLTGEDADVNGNWYRLVKATGTSSSKGAGGGTFGIGKGAPIAASQLRTVFYSSINDKIEPVFQGKARLVSYHDEKKDVRRGVGFYGINGHQAIRNSNQIPEIFKRQEQGTNIYIIGYNSGDDWQKRLIKSILHNFWLAILHGNLEVTVIDGTEILINKNNLKKCLEEYDAENAKFFYEAVTNYTEKFRRDLQHIGEVTLYVRKQEDYPRTIMLARKPKMLVREKPFRVLREPFAGVFICENDRGNDLLRMLEPPAHDKWDEDRDLRGPVAIEELEDFIRESLRVMGEALTSKPEDIPGLDHYLPNIEESEPALGGSEDAIIATELQGPEESGREVGVIKDPQKAESGKDMRKGTVTSKTTGRIIPKETGKRGLHGKGGRQTGKESGSEEGVRIKTSAIGFRSFAQKVADGFEYTLIINGREECEGAIRLVAVGDDNNYPLFLHSAMEITTGKYYEIKDSMITGLTLKGGEILKFILQVDSKKKYTLAIENYDG